MEVNFDVCPIELANNNNVVKFADVDGSAFVFADMPGGRVLPSCGGGMPPEVPTENIRAFTESAAESRSGA